MNCMVCGIELLTDKAKTCSPRCRVALSRKRSVTAHGSVTARKPASVTFRFTIKVGNTDHTKPPYNSPDVVEAKSKIREAKYWYDVPLAAVPVIEEGWPEMPEYMNGRQYFLWWKNDFKVSTDVKEGPIGDPIILNPFPVRDNVRYEMAGEGSRRWGA